MRNIGFDECDTAEEVCGWFNKIFTNLTLMEVKIEQLNNEVEALKPKKKKGKTVKKKGSIRTNILVGLVLLVMAGLCFGGYKTTDINYVIAGNPEMLAQYLRDSFANMTSETYIFTPGSQPSSADTTEGMVYYDSSGSLLYICLDGTNWTNIDTGAVSGYSLDASYNEGYAIAVDGTAITLTVTDGDNNGNLILTNNDATYDPAALVINMASSQHGIAIDVDGQTSGTDFAGTGDSFVVSGAGLVSCVGLTVTTEDIELEYGAEIQNSTDTEIKFIEDDGSGDEDFSIDFQNNALVLKSGSSVASLDFGPIDDLIGVGTIVFDDATGAAITLTGGTGTYDLTVSQAGTAAVSLILSSAGATTDALSLLTTDASGVLKINSNASTIDMDAASGMTIDIAGASGEDLVITNTGGSISIIATENQANAIVIDASDAAGGIDIDAGTGNIDIDIATGDFLVDCDLVSIDGTGASNITFTNGAGEDVTISTAGAADHSLIIQATGTTGDALQVITTAGGIDITNGGAAGGEDIDIVSTNASVNISAGEDVEEGITIANSTGGINITADGGSAKDLDLVCTNGSANLSGGEADAAAVVIAAAAGGIDITAGGAGLDIDISSAGLVLVTATEAAANQFKVDATGTIADASGSAIVFETTNGGILLDADNASNGDIDMEADDDINITAGGQILVSIGDTMIITDDDIVDWGTSGYVSMNYDADGDDNLQVIGPVDFETTYIEFRSNPVVCEDDGTAVNGDNADTNLMAIDGYNFEYYLMGDGQTILIPSMTDDGLNVRLDETDNDGIEMTEGITTRSKSAHTTNTHSMYFKVKFKIESVGQLDIMCVGFRLAAAYNADMYSHNTYTGLNVNNGTINVVEAINGAAAAEDDSGDTWSDGETKTLEVRIDAAGDTTWWVDGSAISNQGSLAFDWSDNDVAIPFVHILGDATVGCEVELVSWECGIYTQ